MLKFNPTGTHIHKGFLKVRVDYYPEPGDACYAACNVLVPAKDPPAGLPEEQFEQWFKDVPKKLQLNPALCHFVTIPQDISSEQLQAYLNGIFTADSIATIASAVLQSNSAHLLSPYMGSKPVLSTERIAADTDAEALLLAVNGRLTELALPTAINGIASELTAQSIDIGAAAIDRGNNIDYSTGATWIDLNNPANDTGTLTTVEIWARSNTTGTIAATYYNSGGTTFVCRDSESIGNITAGSKQTVTGLSISVTSADYIGCWVGSAGAIERDTTGYSGIYYYIGQKTNPSDSASYTNLAGDAISIYATDAGGTAYNLTPSDGLSLADSRTGAVSIVEADAVSLGDALASAYSMVKADALSIVDSLKSAYSMAVQDAVTLSDVISRAVAIISADGLTLADGLAQAVGLTKADAMSLSDSRAASVDVSPADAITLSDGFSRVLGWARGFTDTLGLSDIQTKSFTTSRSDGLSLSDLWAHTGMALSLALADVMTITDGLSKAVRTWKSDALSAIDSLSITAAIGALWRIPIKRLRSTRLSLSRINIMRLKP